MTKLPAIKSKELEKVLLKTGFEFVRQKGSHRMYIRGIYKVVIPYHTKDLKKGTLKNILKQANISVKEFSKLL
jgi:predicted RNA binding protein YcfA (HicA-like mRNA interferase family)